MAVAEEKTSPETSEKSWHGIVLQALKRNDIRLVPYVPDRVLTTLIKNLHADPFFTTFPTAREEEAVGIVSGAWMGGMRGAVLMQTSGFATLANVLASLAIPYQIPLIMFVWCWIRSRWSTTPPHGSTSSNSSSIAPSSRPSPRRRRWR